MRMGWWESRKTTSMLEKYRDQFLLFNEILKMKICDVNKNMYKYLRSKLDINRNKSIKLDENQTPFRVEARNPSGRFPFY